MSVQSHFTSRTVLSSYCQRNIPYRTYLLQHCVVTLHLTYGTVIILSPRCTVPVTPTYLLRCVGSGNIYVPLNTQPYTCDYPISLIGVFSTLRSQYYSISLLSHTHLCRSIDRKGQEVEVVTLQRSLTIHPRNSGITCSPPCCALLRDHPLNSIISEPGSAGLTIVSRRTRRL